ncbi:hypothetical protein DGG96_00815 [Legionella qingyii]|uniref:Ankyrin repeat domain-containing protein n=1 Tax=Legionella qingyii TaxID=2184757 RepID=A0A317U8Z5_9GAMM|nr:ankyrin repeat domain-containing protein [Legionella qingyii]PWY57668.1 hypothetical protein DGG96_00815 [Legionella qingyii]RUR25865.1 ankyrin repeat domain-containing protein [Legionella qingyii]RUR29254.1 ankyrin repeat domain-containing protein [Legionella qingyii]
MYSKDLEKISRSYEGNDLLIATSCGDLEEVEKILNAQPELYTYRNPQQRQGTKYHKSTAVHFSLLYRQYMVAEMLLKHPDNKKIINTANGAGETILQLIVALPYNDVALKLAKLALDVQSVDINYTSHDCNHFQSALSLACAIGLVKTMDMDMVRLLLERGADPNCIIGNLGVVELIPLLNHLALKLNNASEKNIKNLNELMLLLIENGADPTKRGCDGLTFFDVVIDNNIESKLMPTIKKHFHHQWKESSPGEIEKAIALFNASLPFAPWTMAADCSPTWETLALLVTLKKERRAAKQSDHDCTVFYGKEQLESFLEFAKMRFEATKQPFQTQFIMSPRGSMSNHVANGQLNYDEHGQVNVFWVDTLGHDDSNTQLYNAEVGAIIHKHEPEAILYTTDIQMQFTNTGCDIFALYISERLSAAALKKRELFNDLKKIHEYHKIEREGFRVIPWGKCPVYTGLPKIIQSASRPEQRIKEELVADKNTFNKKNENYHQEMHRRLMERQGKQVNSYYEVNRQKFGIHLKKAYEEEYDTLNKKSLLAFTDLINRVPIDVLIRELDIEWVQNGDEWEIVVPQQYHGPYLTDLKGTLPELLEKLDNAYEGIADDKYAMQDPYFHFYYAAIRVCRTKLGSLAEENQKEKNTQEKARFSLALPLHEAEKQQLLVNLEQLSGKKNWKLNQNSGLVAVLEVPTQREACIITEILQATNAMNVVQSQRQDNKLPVIKCDQINCKKLNELASSHLSLPLAAELCSKVI